MEKVQIRLDIRFVTNYFTMRYSFFYYVKKGVKEYTFVVLSSKSYSTSLLVFTLRIQWNFIL